MKKKKKRNKKRKANRNKKYKGAAAQSARDKKDSYATAIDYISNYSNKINSIQNSLAFLDKPFYQPNILNAITGFQKQFSAFHDFKHLLPKTDHLKGFGHLAELSRNSTLAFSTLIKPSSIEAMSKAITGNLGLQAQQRIIQGTLLSNSYFKDLQIPAITNSLSAFAESQKLFSFGLQSSLIKATELNLFAEKNLSGFNWNNIGLRIGINQNEKSLLQKSFLDFSTDFSNLLKTYDVDGSKILSSNPEFIKIPSIEYFTSSNLIEAISIEEEITSEEEILKTDIQYENEYSLTAWLPKVDNGLLNMWKGAVEALHSTNPDKIRHFVTSIRELYTHVLHLLAPDEKIASWSKDPNHYFNGKQQEKQDCILFVEIFLVTHFRNLLTKTSKRQ